MDFLDKIKQKAKQNKQTIVLPEGEEIRVLKAVHNLLKEDVVDIVLIGNEEKIRTLEEQNNLQIKKAKILNPKENKYKEELANALYELRKEKGMTHDEANRLIGDEQYFAMMLLKENKEKITGLVSGSIHSTADTLRPALQIIKTAKSSKLVSAFFIMDTKQKDLGDDGIYIFSDCGLNPNPSAEELAYIAIDSAKSFRQIIGDVPKVAMLSYSSFGSAQSELTKKVVEATSIAKKIDNQVILDGELQLDSAIVPEIAKMKAKDSKIQGDANVLIFPDLNAGNIGYKLVQRIAKADAFGPLCQGLNMPVNDLSRGSTVTDIEGVIVITAIQAQNI